MGLIKTTLIAVGGVTACGLLLAAWHPVSSYVRTGAHVAHEAALDAVPLGFEVERIETLVNDLDEVIREQNARLVKQEVDLEYLQQEVERAEARIDGLTDEVKAARAVLSHERAVYTINGRNYDRSLVVDQAGAKADALVRARAIAEAKRATLTTLDNAIKQARTQLREASQQRETYALRLTELRAKAENVAMRQELVARLDHLPSGIDTGAFSEVESAFERVERELAVQDRMLNERGDSSPNPAEISFTPEPEQDVLAALDAVLAEPAPGRPAPAADLPAAGTHVALMTAE